MFIELKNLVQLLYSAKLAFFKIKSFYSTGQSWYLNLKKVENSTSLLVCIISHFISKKSSRSLGMCTHKYWIWLAKLKIWKYMWRLSSDGQIWFAKEQIPQVIFGWRSEYLFIENSIETVQLMNVTFSW